MAPERVTRFLNIGQEDKIITIRENGKANSSFILSSIIGKCISEDESICLFITHNTLGHFNNIGRLLGYDILAYMKSDRIKIFDLLKEMINIVKCDNIQAGTTEIFKEIVKNVEFLSKTKRTTFILEDASHLFDLGMNFKVVLMYMKLCTHLAAIDNVRVVINCHVSTEDNERLCNMLFHMSDILITVSALKTGISRNVTGTLEIERPEHLNPENVLKKFYHYKLEENDIKVFTPGVGL